jgi:hypothetical protein
MKIKKLNTHTQVHGNGVKQKQGHGEMLHSDKHSRGSELLNKMLGMDER